MWRKFRYHFKRIIFKSGSINLRDWPLTILLAIVFLRRNYIREFCCYCNETEQQKFFRSTRTGDSGGICPVCLHRESPAAYIASKRQGQITGAQALEAEHGIKL